MKIERVSPEGRWQNQPTVRDHRNRGRGNSAGWRKWDAAAVVGGQMGYLLAAGEMGGLDQFWHPQANHVRRGDGSGAALRSLGPPVHFVGWTHGDGHGLGEHGGIVPSVCVVSRSMGRISRQVRRRGGSQDAFYCAVCGGNCLGGQRDVSTYPDDGTSAVGVVVVGDGGCCRGCACYGIGCGGEWDRSGNLPRRVLDVEGSMQVSTTTAFNRCQESRGVRVHHAHPVLHRPGDGGPSWPQLAARRCMSVCGRCGHSSFTWALPGSVSTGNGRG